MEILQTCQYIMDIYGFALPTALVIAITCSLYGVLVILKRIVFIGITLSEVAACGVAFSLYLKLPPLLGAIILTIIAVLFLSYPFEFTKIPRDAILGGIFILAASMSILLVSKSGFGLEKVRAILHGDLLFASKNELLIINLILLPTIIYIFIFFKPTLYSFLDREGSKVLGIKVHIYELLFFIGLGFCVSVSSKIAGVLLVFTYLVVSPATGLILTRKILPAVIFSIIFAIMSTFLGIYFSYIYDLPPNQVISVSACLLFIILNILKYKSIYFDFFYKNTYIAVPTVIIIILIVYNSCFQKIVLSKKISAKNLNKNKITNSNTLKINFKNPMTASTKIINLIQKDYKKGISKAVKFLETNPPFLFREEIAAIINKKASSKWNISLPADSAENKSEKQKILNFINTNKDK